MMRHISTRGSGALQEFVPGHFALGLIRQASEQARERGFRRAGGHAVRLAFHDAGEERFDRVDGDLALRFGLLDQAAVAQVVRILQGRIPDWSVPAVIRALPRQVKSRFASWLMDRKRPLLSWNTASSSATGKATNSCVRSSTDPAPGAASWLSTPKRQKATRHEQANAISSHRSGVDTDSRRAAHRWRSLR